MVSTATFAALDEVWKDDDEASGSLLPSNPYKSADFQRKVLTDFDLGVPSKDAKKEVQQYLQQLYEDEGADAVDRLLPATSKTRQRKKERQPCKDRETVIQRVLEDEDDEDHPISLPTAPHLGPDVIFFMVLAVFVTWWILSSDPSDFK